MTEEQTNNNTNDLGEAEVRASNSVPDTVPAPPVPKRTDLGETDTKVQEDVARILDDVKLPERKVFQAKADTSPTAHEDAFTPPVTTMPRAGASTDTSPGEPTILEETIIPHKDEVEQDATGDSRKEEEQPKMPSIRTFRNDLTTLVRVNKVSLVKAAALEQEKNRGKKTIAEQEGAQVDRRKYTKIFMIVGVIAVLVLLGSLALGAVFFIQSQRTSTVSVAPETSIMFAEQTVSLPLTGSRARDILNQLAQARAQAVFTLGSVTRIVPVFVETNSNGATVERPASFIEFLNAINAQLPVGLETSFMDEFFLGFHTIDKNTPVIVVPVSSYERAFGGMLAWEKTINDDFAPFFSAVPHETTDAEGNLVLGRFEDIIVRNYDVRALKNRNGEIKMLYAFPTRGVLIIAESTHSFDEALSRLRAERRI